jgi:hypothetical protein
LETRAFEKLLAGYIGTRVWRSTKCEELVIWVESRIDGDVGEIAVERERVNSSGARECCHSKVQKIVENNKSLLVLGPDEIVSSDNISMLSAPLRESDALTWEDFAILLTKVIDLKYLRILRSFGVQENDISHLKSQKSSFPIVAEGKQRCRHHSGSCEVSQNQECSWGLARLKKIEL